MNVKLVPRRQTQENFTNSAVFAIVVKAAHPLGF